MLMSWCKVVGDEMTSEAVVKSDIKTYIDKTWCKYLNKNSNNLK